MKSNEFITEGPFGVTEKETAEGIVSILMNECLPFLDEIGYDLYRYTLFRGVRNSVPNQFVMARPEERQPTDTPYNDHVIADDFFYKKFGVKYRSNAFFVTGSTTQAENYGDVYVAFPLGPFSCCWSADVNDMTNDLSNWQDNAYLTGKTTKLTPTQVTSNFFKQAKYGPGNIKKAIYSGNEIMLAAKGLYMVKYKLSLVEMISELLIKRAKGAS